MSARCERKVTPQFLNLRKLIFKITINRPESVEDRNEKSKADLLTFIYNTQFLIFATPNILLALYIGGRVYPLLLKNILIAILFVLSTLTNFSGCCHSQFWLLRQPIYFIISNSMISKCKYTLLQRANHYNSVVGSVWIFSGIMYIAQIIFGGYLFE